GVEGIAGLGGGAGAGECDGERGRRQACEAKFEPLLNEGIRLHGVTGPVMVRVYAQQGKMATRGRRGCGPSAWPRPTGSSRAPSLPPTNARRMRWRQSCWTRADG